MKESLNEIRIDDFVVVLTYDKDLNSVYSLRKVTAIWKSKFEVSGRQFSRSTGKLIGATMWSRTKAYAPLDTIGGRSNETYLSLVSKE